MLELFLTFAKIGLFTFGGGYAMIAVIEDACCAKKNWMSHEEMLELIVIAESTPGPIAINCATWVGCKRMGFRGALAATVGMVLPSLLIIFAISLFLDNFLEIGVIAHAFRGIRVGVGVLILNAGWNMLKKTPKQPLHRGVLVVSLIAILGANLLGVKLSAILLMVLGGAVSLAAYHVKGGMEK